MNTTLELEDMQGLIIRGYEKLPEAKFLLLQINDATGAKQYLASILGQITTAANKPEHTALHIAFTASGLHALQLPPSVLASFQREFLEGMQEPTRAHILGDTHLNAPAQWQWGGPNNGRVDLLLLCYANTPSNLDQLCALHINAFKQYGIYLIKTQETETIPRAKEHFGFRDGISKPFIEGLKNYSEQEKPVIKAGEFILGYENEYENYTSSPLVPLSEDPENILPIYIKSNEHKDLGKNGTYLIYRQMTQDVPGFWKYLKENSKEPANTNEEAAIKLGAKMVGRWPEGAPLVLSSEEIDTNPSTENNFGYWKEDPEGMKCPFGAHIRRNNPRDFLLTERSQSTNLKLNEKRKEVSVEMIRKHQILRRGRSFGKPLDPSMEPEKLMAASDDGVFRGLHFICLAGHISRQFEFILNAWSKSPTFSGLYNDSDPLGAKQASDHLDNEFTCPAAPARRKYRNMPQFTQLVGGAYFFLPGIKALQYIIKTP